MEARHPEETALMVLPEEISVGALDQPLRGYDGQSVIATGPAGLTQAFRFKGTAVLIFVLVAILCIPAVWLFLTPEYVSTAVVRVAPIIQRIVFKDENSGMVPLYQAYVNKQVGHIQSSQ